MAQKLGTIILYALTLPNINRVFTSNVQCILLAAGRRTQAGDAAERAIGQWRHRLACVVQQQGGYTEHLMLLVAMTSAIY